jgi:hypothetical protein
VAHLVAGDQWGVLGQAEHLQRRAGRQRQPAGGDRPLDPSRGELGEQLTRAGQGPHGVPAPGERLGVGQIQRLDLVGGQRAARFAQQGRDEQAAAHADAPVQLPHRQFHADRGQRLLPGQNVLVDAVDEGAVEIEEQGRDAPLGDVSAHADHSA